MIVQKIYLIIFKLKFEYASYKQHLRFLFYLLLFLWVIEMWRDNLLFLLDYCFTIRNSFNSGQELGIYFLFYHSVHLWKWSWNVEKQR